MYSVVAPALLAVAGGGYYASGVGQGAVDPTAGAVTVTATRGPFVHTIVERGEVESSQNVEIRCELKSKSGASTILWIIPEGTFVNAGDKVIEFDASLLREMETQQVIVYNQARAAMIQAKLAHETAEIAVQEYIHGTFEQETKTVESEIVVAKENLRRAEDYAEYSERLARKGYVSEAQLEADRFAVINAQLTLENAETKKKVLTQYTRAKTLKQLESDVGSAEASHLAQQASLKLEEEKLSEIRDQIAKCVVYSPAAGQVVYANEVDRRGNVEMQIAEGITVRERQVIIRLPNMEAMQVRTMIQEAKIGLVEVGQTAQVQVDAIRGRKLTGRIVRVDAIAISDYYSSIKQYNAFVEIKSPPPELKPGMTANVEITVNERPDSVLVPVQSVSRRSGQHWVCLRTPNGPEARSVRLGPNNDNHVVVLEGLDPEAVVVMDPDDYLADLVPVDAEALASEEGDSGEEPRRRRPDRIAAADKDTAKDATAVAGVMARRESDGGAQ